MNRTKGSFWNIGCCLGGILLSPVFLIILLVHILYTPIDFIIFMTSEYRRQTGQKYVWLVTTSKIFRLFSIIQKNNLDIKYYPIAGTTSACGYLVTGNVLIDYDSFTFLAEDGNWYVNVEDADQKLDTVEGITLSNFEKEHGFCPRRVVYLIEQGDIGEEEHLNKARMEKNFFIYNKKEAGSLVHTLIAIIEAAKASDTDANKGNSEETFDSTVEKTEG